MARGVKSKGPSAEKYLGRGLSIFFARSKHPELHLWMARLVVAVAILGAVWVLEEGWAAPLGSGNGDAAAYDLSGKPVTVPASSEGGPRIGKVAPDFLLLDLEGNPWQLSALKGKTVILNFWATWCPPCRAEMPELDALYQTYKGQDVVVLGVNLREDAPKVKRFSNVLNLTFPVLLDPRGIAVAQYNIVALPTTFFIDRNGVVQDINIGALSDKGLEAKLRKAME